MNRVMAHPELCKSADLSTFLSTDEGHIQKLKADSGAPSGAAAAVWGLWSYVPDLTAITAPLANSFSSTAPPPELPPTPGDTACAGFEVAASTLAAEFAAVGAKTSKVAQASTST